MCKLIIASMLIFCLISSISTHRTAQSQHSQCQGEPRCSNVENVVWATDNQTCYVFLNSCLLLTENCSRLRNKLPALKTVSKEKCQPLCPTMCTMQYDPVCAEYRGQRREFGNSCQLGVHICLSGEVYQFLFRGECQPQNIN